MKKIVSILLAMIMLLAIAAPAMAAMEGTLTGGSITITNAIPGQDYSAYQILYLESYSTNEKGEATGAYAYQANSAWAEWLATQEDYVAIDEQGYVTWVDGADVAEFAKLAQAQLADKTADATATAPAAAEGATTSTVELTGLKLGYYLVDTTLGTLCSLDTTNPTVEMQEKNEAPTVTKEVKEDSTGKWGETNDADINQTVEFKATITVQAGAENYVLHDTMSAGLTYIGVTSVQVDGKEVDKANYTVADADTCEGGCTFEVAFKDEYIATLSAGTQIVVEYSATLNKNAVVGLPGNDNEVKLEYGDANDPSYTTPDKTITYTWDMDILKYANGDEAKVLADAKFVLLNSDKSKVAKIEDGKFVEWVTIITEDAATEENPETDLTDYQLTTNASGKIEIDGLDADTYYLRETAAPAGYNKLAEDVKIDVKGAEEKEVEGKTTLTYETVVAKVNNQSGTELPSTGGIGTTIFYIAGAILVVGAVVVLISKKRSSEK